MSPTAPASFYARRGKRALDATVAAVALVAGAPLLALLALAVKVDSRGPVFYRQERIGRDGRAFRLHKFRSMVVGAESRGAGIRVEPGDARITRVGRWLRRLSLDELPQLIDVFRGDMSLVGPRPTLRYQVEQYDERQRRRLLVRPGVTGWAQVHGRNAIDWARRIDLDLEYVKRLSFRLDAVIVLRTIPAVLRGGDQIASAEFWRRKSDPGPRGDGGPA